MCYQSLKAFWIFRNLFTLYTQVYEFVYIPDSFAYCLCIRDFFSLLFQSERAQFGYRRYISTLGRRLDLGLGLGLVLLAALTGVSSLLMCHRNSGYNIWYHFS